MNLATQKKSSEAKAPVGENKQDDNEMGSDSDSLVETDHDDSRDADSEGELDETANKKPISKKVLPASAFLYQKDLLFDSDHQSKNSFDHSDKYIEFVCQQLHFHGFSFLMENAKLDTFQLDLLMMVSWEMLHPLKKQSTLKLATDETLQDLIISQVESEEELAEALVNKTTIKTTLQQELPPQEVQINAAMDQEADP
jgi:hypothetical protein